MAQRNNLNVLVALSFLKCKLQQGLIELFFFPSIFVLHFLDVAQTGEKSACSDPLNTMRQ